MTNYADKAVLFDMDGLMLDTERIYVRVWQEAARDLGYELGDELFVSFVGLSVVELLALAVDARGRLFSRSGLRARWEDARGGDIFGPRRHCRPPLLDWLDGTCRAPW